MTQETIIQNTIFRTVQGSLVYGTEVTKEETNHYGLDFSSDEDFFEITVAPLQDIFSLTNPFQSDILLLFGDGWFSVVMPLER